jgi:hypothetical protein
VKSGERIAWRLQSYWGNASRRFTDNFRVADSPCGVMSHAVRVFQAAFDLHFAVDRLNQSPDVSITERIGLETTRIIRITGHVIRANRARELRVPQDSHNF